MLWPYPGRRPAPRTNGGRRLITPRCKRGSGGTGDDRGQPRNRRRSRGHSDGYSLTPGWPAVISVSPVPSGRIK